MHIAIYNIARAMPVDQHSFFHQGAMAICSTLDISESVRKCGEYIKRYIPLDGIGISIYDPDSRGLRIFALHGEAHGGRTERLVILTTEELDRLKREIESVGSGGPTVIANRPTDAPFASLAAGKAGIQMNAHLTLNLTVEQERLGAVLVYSSREDVFTREHARLLALLHDPFAIALSNALRYRQLIRLQERLKDENRFLYEELHEASGDEIVGHNMGLKGVMAMVNQVAALDSSVLLMGETGVGKEVIANAIHRLSPRSRGPLVKVNCGAIPESLIDSELFGHERGAFTGALSKKRGRFERADGGTIFLDEAAELPQAAQIRLLRVIQAKEIERVGGSEPIPVDVRIISATHRDLMTMVQNGQFREDLWFRLNVFPINIPPLRERKTDIPALVTHFIHRKARAMNLNYTPVPAPGALERLQQHHWPGNVRELENAVERELIRSYTKGPNQPLAFDDPTQSPSSGGPAEPRTRTEGGRVLTMDEIARDHLDKVLRLTNGKIQGAGGAADLLGLHPSTLRSRMRKLGLPFGRYSD